jgi:hypothetical protein
MSEFEESMSVYTDKMFSNRSCGFRKALACSAVVFAPFASQVMSSSVVHAAACVPNERGTDTETILTFRTTGTCQWTVPSGVTSVRALIVAGGGGGGSDNGGGGGGGGVIHDQNITVTPGASMNIVVGNGGAGAVNASSVASNGGNSSFASLVARGGGGGGSIDNTAGADGGSAGGRAANRWGGAQDAIATTSPSQGNNGGAKLNGGFGGGGGGGASSAGGSGGSNMGGNGGDGFSSDIDLNFQELLVFGGGGGGGGDSNNAGDGGSGGGGAGSRRGDQTPTAGLNGHGGGGGGAGGSVAGGLGARGGSGVVILRFTRTVSTYAVIYEGYSATLTAPTGRTFTNVAYASYGTPSGAYGSYVAGDCHEANTRDILLPLVVGQNSVTISADNGVFGDPCGGTYKWLAVSLALSAPPVVATTTTTSVVTTTTAPAVSPTVTTTPPALDIVVVAPATSVVPGTTVPIGQSQIPSIAGTSKSTPSTTTPLLTATTTTTVNPSGTIAPKVPKAPSAPSVVAGSAAVNVGGKTETATVERSNNQLVVSVGALKAVVGGLNPDGSQMALDDDGNVRLNTGDTVRIKLAGFKPGTQMEAWLFSTPVLLGTSKVGVDGAVTGSFTIPKNAPEGAHRVVIVAQTMDGKPATLAVGINVGEWDSGPGVAVWLIVLPIALAVVGGLLLPAQRRRRRAAGEM